MKFKIPFTISNIEVLKKRSKGFIKLTRAKESKIDEYLKNADVKIERREHQRHNIPATVTCTFFEETLQGKGKFCGFIQDISYGGVFLELRDDFLNLTESMLPHTNIEMTFEFNFPDGINKMDFSGIIKWDRRVKKNGKSFLCLGIQFHTLDERRKEIIKRYLSLGAGDKNLIWNLWDNLSVQP